MTDVIDAELLPVLANDTRPALVIPTAQPTVTAERRTPTGEATIAADVAVPALQATFTAGAVLVGVGLIALALGWSVDVMLLCGGIAMVAGWFWRLAHSDRARHVVETVTRLDLDGDGQIGAPSRAYTVMQPAAARAAVAAETQQAAASAERAALLAFVDACYIRGCGEHAHGIKASGPGRAEFVKMRDTLITLGVAGWKSPGSPKAGWQMVVSRQRARQLVEKHVL